MKIRIDPDLAERKGSFGRPEDGALAVPARMQDLLKAIGSSQAELLYDTATLEPDLVRDMLGWSDDEVEAAIRELKAMLQASGSKILDYDPVRAEDLHFGHRGKPET